MSTTTADQATADQATADYSATLARILTRDWSALSDAATVAMSDEDQADIAALAASDVPLPIKAAALRHTTFIRFGDSASRAERALLLSVIEEAVATGG